MTDASEQRLVDGIYVTSEQYHEALPLAKHLFVTEWRDDNLTWDAAFGHERAACIHRAVVMLDSVRAAGFDVRRTS